MQIKEDFDKITNEDNDVINSVKNINSQQGGDVIDEKNEFSKVLVDIEVPYHKIPIFFFFFFFLINTVK